MPPRPFSRSSHAVAQSRRARASHESHRRHQGHGRRRSGRAAINAPCRREIRLLGCASQTRARRCCRWCPDVARSSASRSRRLRHPDEPSGRPTLGGSPTARFSAFRADTHCARKSLAAGKRGCARAWPNRSVCVNPSRVICASAASARSSARRPDSKMANPPRSRTRKDRSSRFAGGIWLAKRQTAGRPGGDDSGWRLVCKEGRAG